MTQGNWITLLIFAVGLAVTGISAIVGIAIAVKVLHTRVDNHAEMLRDHGRRLDGIEPATARIMEALDWIKERIAELTHSKAP